MEKQDWPSRQARRSNAPTHLVGKARRGQAWRTMEEGVVPAPGTRIRAWSLPLPGGEAASLHHEDGQKLALAHMKGRMPQIYRGITEREGKSQPIMVKKVLFKEPDLVASSILLLSTESTLLSRVHSLISKKGMSPNWVRRMIYTRERTSSSSSSSCMGAGLTILLPNLSIFCLLEISHSRRR
jgi:hypothetical protein